ncbi:MAG: GNAT family N-acetyltransferase [Gammaproteobacteria bacterium]
MNIPTFFVEPANYQADLEDLRYVRTGVFVVEQQIPPDIEFDELDSECHHFIGRDDQRRPIATGRLAPDGKIGRMAVIKEWRGQGVGEAMLLALIEKARKLGFSTLVANAQVSALGFYQKFGFVAEGGEFSEAGIPHQLVRLWLKPMEEAQYRAVKPLQNSVPAVRVENLAFSLVVTRKIIEDARRELYIYSRDLEFGLYGQLEIVAALKQFALGNRNSLVQIIVQEPLNLRGRVHPLLELAQRLTSHFSLRMPVEAEDLQKQSAFFINDCGGYLFSSLGERYEGHWSPYLPARHRQLQEEFERIWQRSSPCTEFRALGI